MSDRLKSFEESQKELNKALKGDLEKEGNYQKINFMYVKEGQSKYRLLPYRPVHMVLKHYGKHFGISFPNTQKGGIWACSMDKYGSCPLCEEYQRSLELEGDTKKGSAWKKKATRAFWFLALDEEGNHGILQMEWNCYKAWEAFKKECKGNSDYQDMVFEGFEDGHAVTISVKKKPNFTEFTFLPSPNASAVTEKMCDDMFATYPEYAVLNKTFSPDELNMALDNDFAFMEKDDEEKKDTKAKDKAPALNTKEIMKESSGDDSTEAARLADLEKEFQTK